jgi:hypothetical protein
MGFFPQVRLSLTGDNIDLSKIRVAIPFSTCRSLSLTFISGYDFGYFIKLLTGLSLPTTEEAFFELLQIWFPIVYDIRYLMRTSKVLKGTLQDVADDLGVCCSHCLLKILL